jgi:hypothetical protein
LQAEEERGWGARPHPNFNPELARAGDKFPSFKLEFVKKTYNTGDRGSLWLVLRKTIRKASIKYRSFTGTIETRVHEVGSDSVVLVAPNWLYDEFNSEFLANASKYINKWHPIGFVPDAVKQITKLCYQQVTAEGMEGTYKWMGMTTAGKQM